MTDHLTDGITVMMNTQSGNVFLTDDDFNVMMLNGDDLEPFLSTPYDGHEGFADELLEEPPSEYHKEDAEYLQHFVNEWRHHLCDIHEGWLQEKEEAA